MKMFENVNNRPPLLEEPFVQTLSGKNMVESSAETSREVYRFAHNNRKDMQRMNSLQKEKLSGRKDSVCHTKLATLKVKCNATFHWGCAVWLGRGFGLGS